MERLCHVLRPPGDKTYGHGWRAVGLTIPSQQKKKEDKPSRGRSIKEKPATAGHRACAWGEERAVPDRLLGGLKGVPPRRPVRTARSADRACVPDGLLVPSEKCAVSDELPGRSVPFPTACSHEAKCVLFPTACLCLVKGVLSLKKVPSWTACSQGVKPART